MKDEGTKVTGQGTRVMGHGFQGWQGLQGDQRNQGTSLFSLDSLQSLNSFGLINSTGSLTNDQAEGRPDS